ncbi:hypothetical protein KEH51_24810 [[Brevibacterium] frigoritolerans]|uniref:Mur ligase central domain-containing protein n=1 Tax=Peribacillus frigoritolerans TaxID=450367 RepID=A0A941FND8_9BACI|nr:hypothetical protein [Peribacillus frigoritolerans]
MGKDFRVSDMKRSERGQSFTFALADRSIENVEMRMLGRHQMENAALAIAAVTVGMENIDEKASLKE